MWTQPHAALDYVKKNGEENKIKMWDLYELESVDEKDKYLLKMSRKFNVGTLFS